MNGLETTLLYCGPLETHLATMNSLVSSRTFFFCVVILSLATAYNGYVSAASVGMASVIKPSGVMATGARTITPGESIKTTLLAGELATGKSTTPSMFVWCPCVTSTCVVS